MELKPSVVSDDGPNKDINVAFYNIAVIKRSVNSCSSFLC